MTRDQLIDDLSQAVTDGIITETEKQQWISRADNPIDMFYQAYDEVSNMVEFNTIPVAERQSVTAVNRDEVIAL